MLSFSLWLSFSLSNAETSGSSEGSQGEKGLTSEETFGDKCLKGRVNEGRNRLKDERLCKIACEAPSTLSLLTTFGQF